MMLNLISPVPGVDGTRLQLDEPPDWHQLLGDHQAALSPHQAKLSHQADFPQVGRAKTLLFQSYLSIYNCRIDNTKDLSINVLFLILMKAKHLKKIVGVETWKCLDSK